MDKYTMECYPEVKINELLLWKKMDVLETMLSEKNKMIPSPDATISCLWVIQQPFSPEPGEEFHIKKSNYLYTVYNNVAILLG